MGGRGPPLPPPPCWLAELEKLEVVAGSNSSGLTRSRSRASPIRMFRSTMSPLEGCAIVSKNLIVWMKRFASSGASTNCFRMGCLKHAARMIRLPH